MRRPPASRFWREFSVGLATVALSISLLFAPATSRAQAAAAPVAWKNVADGIELVEFSMAGSLRQQPVHAFRIDLQRTRLRLVPAGDEGTRLPVPRIAAPFSEYVAINASFFDDIDRPIGVVVDNHTPISRRLVKTWGALVIADHNATIVLGQSLKLEPPPLLVAQGLPRLIIGGELVKLKPQTADRTAVCAAGHTLIIAITGAVEASALAEMLRDRLGCRDALNFDGGPSTQLSVRLGKLRIDVPGWAVPNALIVLPGPQ